MAKVVKKKAAAVPAAKNAKGVRQKPAAKATKAKSTKKK